MEKKHLIFITFIFLMNSLVTFAKPTSDAWPRSLNFCQCPAEYILNCVGFENFAQLNFSQTITDSCFDGRKVFDLIALSPRSPSPFNDKVNIEGILSSPGAKVNLENIESFHIQVNQFKTYTKMYELTLSKSNFTFNYANGILLSTRCNLNQIDFDSIDSIFKKFDNLILTSSIKYEEKTCPFIFKDVSLSSVSIYNLNDNANSLVFLESLTIAGERLNSNVKKLEIYQSNLTRLDSRLMNEYVFKQTESLVISESNLMGIDEKLFDKFEHIKTIELHLNTFQGFFRYDNVNWTVYLNRSSSTDRNRQILVGFIDLSPSISYKYPNLELCLFKNWPHENNVFAYIYHSNELYECTCTLVWLLHKWESYTAFSLNNPSVSKCLEKDFLKDKIKECNFQQYFRFWCYPPETTTTTTTTTTSTTTSTSTSTTTTNPTTTTTSTTTSTTTPTTTTTITRTSTTTTTTPLTLNDNPDKYLIIPLLVIGLLVFWLVLFLVICNWNKKTKKITPADDNSIPFTNVNQPVAVNPDLNDGRISINIPPLVMPNTLTQNGNQRVPTTPVEKKKIPPWRRWK